MTEEEGLKRLHAIIDRLDWYAIDACPNGHQVRRSVLDSSSLSDDGVRCSQCGESPPASDFCGVSDQMVSFRGLFQDAIELLAMVVKARTRFGSDVPVVLAHTSLEIFLREAVERKLRKTAVDDRVITFILKDMRPDIKTYLDCLRTLGVIQAIKDKEEEGQDKPKQSLDKFLDSLREVSDWRNAFIHRAQPIGEEQAIRSCEKIAEAFRRLSDLAPTGKPGLAADEGA